MFATKLYYSQSICTYIFNAQNSQLGSSSNVRAGFQCKWKAACLSNIEKAP